ncbi:MAG TPA: MarC family protein [Thermoplasmata archaeon]|nr:MarC family protein [Thermoplasmata archaeon]
MVDLAFGATAMASIFAIVDPLGVVPFFSVLTEGMTPVQKQDIVSKACLTATITLGVFAVFGQWIFAGFGFTIPAFKIAGGILLFGVALEMLNGERSRSRLTPQERAETLERDERDEVAVVPLGIPLLAGPGAITTVMIYMAHPVAEPGDKLFVFAGILVAVLAAFTLLHYADRIFKRIGRTGTRAVGRVMGLLLAAIAVQFIIDGIVDVARLHGLPLA